MVTVTGAGFTDDANVTICDQACERKGGNSTAIWCLTPVSPDISRLTDVFCDVKVTQGSEDETLTDAFTYLMYSTGTIQDVNPKQGGTGGSTYITISGADLDSADK